MTKYEGIYWPDRKHEGKTVSAYEYDPQEDITAFELALIMPMMVGVKDTAVIYSRLPENVKRHIKVRYK